jgi:hypothetical protein
MPATCSANALAGCSHGLVAALLLLSAISTLNPITAHRTSFIAIIASARISFARIISFRSYCHV